MPDQGNVIEFSVATREVTATAIDPVAAGGVVEGLPVPQRNMRCVETQVDEERSILVGFDKRQGLISQQVVGMPVVLGVGLVLVIDCLLYTSDAADEVVPV